MIHPESKITKTKSVMSFTFDDIDVLYQKLVLKSLPVDFESYNPEIDSMDSIGSIDSTDSPEYDPDLTPEKSEKNATEEALTLLSTINSISSIGSIDSIDSIDSIGSIDSIDSPEYNPELTPEKLEKYATGEALALLSSIEYTPGAVDAFQKVLSSTNHRQRNRRSWSKPRLQNVNRKLPQRWPRRARYRSNRS